MAPEKSPWFPHRGMPWAAIIDRLPRRFFRLLSIAFIALLCMTLLVSRSTNHGHHTWTVESVVHGKKIPSHQHWQEPLTPFPYSPLTPQTEPLQHNEHHDQKHRPWLAAVICAAQDVERRMLIRSTWMRLARHLPVDARFVVSNPGPRWMETLRFENQTFGDLIVLDHLHEDDITANTVKTLEFYKWLVHNDRRYEFVSKLDTDLWLNAPGFWTQFLVPRLSNSTGHLTANVSRTIIGEAYYSDSGNSVFAHGSMYTVTWDMMQLLVALQDKFHVVTGEDAAVGLLMHKGEQMANFVNFRGHEKFDYDDRDSRSDESAWARRNTHPDAARHALFGSDIIAVHRLKSKNMWFKVADCFDENGVKPMPAFEKPEKQRTFSLRWDDFLYSTGISNPYMSTYANIPMSFFNLVNGNWQCDGIWNLGKSPAGENPFH